MREIKFKVWEVYKNRWLSDGFAIDCDGRYITTARDKVMEVGKSVYLLQYTGLKDKNGKEIYEGDILRYTYHRDRSGKDIAEFTDVIEWDGDNDSWSGFYVNKKMQHEIIGNIYENPELLNQK